jgi:hypothetical protein
MVYMLTPRAQHNLTASWSTQSHFPECGVALHYHTELRQNAVINMFTADKKGETETNQ